jgi:ribosomal protein L37AE/L43A
VLYLVVQPLWTFQQVYIRTSEQNIVVAQHTGVWACHVCCTQWAGDQSDQITMLSKFGVPSIQDLACCLGSHCTS